MSSFISRKQFEEAYKKFPPRKCELFFLKYFSVHSIRNHVFAELILSILLALPFIFAIIGEVLNLSKTFTYVPSFIYAGILFLLGIYMFSIWLKKRKRLEKIRKQLNITKDEYDNLINIYFYHRYNTVNEYIEYNSQENQ